MPNLVRKEVIKMTGIELKVMRIRAGLQQWKVAANLGFSGTWLSMIESGKQSVTPELAQLLTETIDNLAASQPMKTN